MRAGKAADSFTLTTAPPPQKSAEPATDAIIEHSRTHYAIPVPIALERLHHQPTTPQAPAPQAQLTPGARPVPAVPNTLSNPDKILHYLALAEYLTTPQLIELVWPTPTTTSTKESRQSSISRYLRPLVDEGKIKRHPFQFRGGNLYHTTRTCNPTEHNLAVRDLFVKITRSGWELSAVNFSLDLKALLPDLYVAFLANDGNLIKTLWEYDTGTEGTAEIASKVRRYEAHRAAFHLITCVTADQNRLDQLRRLLPESWLILTAADSFTTLSNPAFFGEGRADPQPFFSFLKS